MHMGYVKEFFGTLVEFDIYTCALNKLKCVSFTKMFII